MRVVSIGARVDDDVVEGKGTESVVEIATQLVPLSYGDTKEEFKQAQFKTV